MIAGRPAGLCRTVCALLLAMAIACAAIPAHAQSCGPGVAGSPCATGQTAGMDSTGGVDQAAGNPINIITGNKYQREADMPALPGVLGLELVRHYNSRLAAPGMPLQGIGRGWQFSYDTRLHALGDTLQIIQADGARIIFARSPWSRSLCTTSDPAQGLVRILRNGGQPGYRWLWPNGRELLFDNNGRLVRISDSSGMAVAIERMADGRISTVTDPQGRSMTFHYLHRNDDKPGRYRGVQSIDTPVGRFLYDYDYDDASTSVSGSPHDPAILSAVHLPTRYDPRDPRPAFALGDTPATSSLSTVKRIYHHEDKRFPTLLTGITVDGAGSDGRPMRERIATWAYDGNGLAVLSVRHAPGSAGKPEAGGVAEQLTFDRSEPGRTRVTDGQGRITTYRHAIVAGAFRLLEARGAGCASCGAVNVRYRHDRYGRVEEVIALDAAGMPVEGRRQQLDALGRAYAVKHVSYRSGKKPLVSLLVRQQFPYPGLPATWPQRAGPPEHFGPKRVAMDSVVPGNTHQVDIAYNARQQVLRVSETGYDPVSRNASTRITRYRYEEINGRSLLVEVDGPLPNGPTGTPADSDITRYEWDERGAYVTRIILAMGSTLDIAYDAHSGRPQTVRYRWDDIVRVSHYAYGSNGQITRHHETAYANDGTTVLAERETGLAGNPHDEVSRITWPDGYVEELTRRWSGRQPPSGASRAEAGLPAVDQPHVLRYDINGKSAERLIDDFGQVVGIRNPGQGWQYASYDAAGRISEIRDARGMLTRASHDAAGRLLHIVRILPGDAYPERLEFGWHGPYRQGETVTTAHKRMHAASYVHTPWGQVSRMQVLISADGGHDTPVGMTLHSRYDAAGRLSARTLPGGERLAYRYYATSPYHGQRAAIEQLHWPRWLDWLMAALPETWLDAGGFKTRLAAFAPRDDGSGADASAGRPFAQAGRGPQAEPGMAGDAPGQQHDAAGLPQRIDTSRGSFALRWNAASQLVSVRSAAATAASGDVAAYTYDAHGRRASKRSATGVEYYLYEGTQLLAVESHPLRGAVGMSQYLYEGFRPVAWLRDGIASLLQTDHRGAVRAVTSAEPDASTRKTLWRGDPGPWGRSPATDAATSRFDPRLRLVNQLADEETGLSYNVARYYDAASGRFISPDPAGIADTLERDVPDALRLDLTAYAAGQPSRYFDPDGAARLVYYAITAGANGKQLGMTQGFTKARWAFSVDGIEASGDGGSDAVNRLMEKYAKNQTGLLFDKNGDFIVGKKIAVAWNGASDETVDQFIRHYGASAIRLSQFTIDSYSNRDAALLIASLIGNMDEAALCPDKNGLLPSIPFAPEEKKLLPTDTNLRQRILNCAETDLTSTTREALRERMLIKLNQAISLNETLRIYNDCSKTGCPSVAAIFITEPDKAAIRLPAAYSHLQFAPETLTEILLDNLMNPVTAASRYEISQERLNKIFGPDDAKAEIIKASTRARWVYVYGNCMAGDVNGYDRFMMSCPDENIISSNWEKLSDSDQKIFIARTGLSGSYWSFLQKRATGTLVSSTDYVSRTNSKEHLDAVAWAAWKTVPVADMWFIEIAKDNAPGGRMDALALAYLQIREVQINTQEKHGLHYSTEQLYPLANGKSAKGQSAIDLEMIMRIARRHNGGSWWLSLSTLKSLDAHNYVKRIAGIGAFDSEGNYPALHCSSDAEIIKRGVAMMPLNLK
jgi:RHS repeat-associated protein